jgi:RecQ family ATP-dependent DNA helicase
MGDVRRGHLASLLGGHWQLGLRYAKVGAMTKPMSHLTEEIDTVARDLAGFSVHDFQHQACEAVLAGRDVLLVAPTGAGKSLCYQIPTRIHGGPTLIVSPLIALMDDQARSAAQLGFAAKRLHSGVEPSDQWAAAARWMAGGPQFLFVSPERLRSPGLLACLKAMPPRLIVVDEAHCISTWGQRFRPAYRSIGEMTKRFPKAPVMAMTATAKAAIQADVTETLGLRSPVHISVPLALANLRLESLQAATSWERAEIIAKLVSDPANLPMVVFCLLRKHCEVVAELLRRQGQTVFTYHGAMTAAERHAVHREFGAHARAVLVATSAYEMGVDKRDVRTVVHYGMPASLESFVQGIGRAGRDQQMARALLLYGEADLDILESMDQRVQSHVSGAETQPLSLDGQEVYAFALTRRCRVDFLRRHFCGSSSAPPYQCGHCDNCRRSGQVASACEQGAIAGQLKAWRRATATRLGKPCFAILTDREIACIAEARPSDANDLLSLAGVRRTSIYTFAAEVLEVIAGGAEIAAAEAATGQARYLRYAAEPRCHGLGSAATP